MGKVLTVSVAAYKVEDYIKQNLDSIVQSEFIDQIEVFVVDDGGDDRTLEIAREYEKKYPGSVYAVHKENGGYGTTVNYSIEHATGKYFKILDGDDWFDTEELNKLIKILNTNDVDAVIGNYYQGYDENHLSIITTHKEKEGTVIDIRNGYTTTEPFDMWSLVYKTSILKKNSITLPAGVLYTDRYYSTYPFAYVNSVYFTDATVYCYRIGRDGQSMSLESQFNHFDTRLNGSLDLCRFYAEERKKNNPRCKYILDRVSSCHLAVCNLILHMPKNKKTLNILKEYEDEVNSISRDIINHERKMGEFGLYMLFCRFTSYLLVWLTPDGILKR